MRALARKPKGTQRTKSARSAIPSRTRSVRGGVVNSILHLQRTIGNRAVQRLLAAQTASVKGDSATTAIARFGHDVSRTPAHANGPVQTQTKLAVNTPGDVHEQEAERVSEQVMRMPEPSLQRACPDGVGGPNCQTEQPGQTPQRVQAKGIGSSGSGQTAAPPIVHDALGSPGQPLNGTTRAFMEPRFGHDFSGVRVHTDGLAARSAEAVAAQAYTVGSDIVFGAGRYAPASRDGQRLLAHELAHVQQQQSGPALQREPLPDEQPQTIPTELLTSANVGQMSDEELTDRHDLILKVLSEFTISTPETGRLEREAARIGVELARRKALAAGRTFNEDSIKKMKDYFVKNAKKPEKPDNDKTAQEPKGGWQDSCIIALNNAMKIATNKPALPTTPATIEKTMAKIAESGHSGDVREVWFKAKGGKISKSGFYEPEKAEASIWDTVMSLAGGDPGWSVFTMSILDGYHSVTLTLDATDPRAPHLYWSDQWKEKGGWKEYTRSKLDTEVTKKVKEWWGELSHPEDPKKKSVEANTVVRVWRVSSRAKLSSEP